MERAASKDWKAAPRLLPSAARPSPPACGNGQQLYECPICQLICTDYPVLQEHVELHLEECSFLEGRNLGDLELAQQLQNEEDRQRKEETARQERQEFQKLQKQYGLDGSGGYKQQSLKNMEKDVALGRMQPSEYHTKKVDMMESLAFGIDDGKTKTSVLSPWLWMRKKTTRCLFCPFGRGEEKQETGITEALFQYYQNECKDIKHVWLSTGVDHFHFCSGDKGWGCGYRNFQMLLSSLLRNSIYKDYLKENSSIPCIPKIQSLIEDAWKEGFDPQGASHFNSRLHGTRAWIGACEIYSLLTSLRLKSQIIDFHQPTGPSGTHPRLFEWILNYYSSDKENSAKVVCSSRPPIYLQHQGHSRTIIGIEERKNKSLCLLIFDPGTPSQEMQKLLKGIDGNNLRSLRRFAGNLKHNQYQIVAIDGVLSVEEKIVRRKASQLFTAQRIP
ncbi:zinc finger-containing ubiquitin peptidase 1 isoform X2 [Anolis carolinensis]|uniref:zinc finger-containing ubiquitin peptidase 1 isoform X2 n=1 Tax=Anolis carolinensis TaxID=28377 RepID=UPI002F2B662A